MILIRNFHSISYEYIGVKGLRVDASKHMWPGDLEAIQVHIVKLIGIKQTVNILCFCVNKMTYVDLLKNSTLEKV